MHRILKSHHLVLLVAASVGACSSGNGESAGAVSEGWDCKDVSIPLGRTFECTSTPASTASSVVGGPAYECTSSGGDGDQTGDCPPPAPVPSPTGCGDDDVDYGASDRCGAADAGAPPRGPGDGKGPKGPGEGKKPGDDHGKGADAGGPVTTGAGGSEGGGYYCTKDGPKRVCRQAPRCNPGAHRLQMDCDGDVSTGVGEGSPTTDHYPGCGDTPPPAPPPGGQTQCYYPTGTPAGSGVPAATVWYVLDSSTGPQLLHVTLTFNPSFVDNSYGANAVGWSKGHKFSDLVGSDHAELSFLDTASVEKLHFKMDYISKSTSAPSGYACLGVTGGEGRMILGDASLITKVSSSLDRNLNDRGYGTFVVDSPATTATYTPPTNAPNWDYRVVYEAWIKNEAFGSSGFGQVKLAFVHASPSKVGSNTVPVTPGPCPDGWIR